MKALSLWQPWATLIAFGIKRVETRGWETSYRGPLAIHAAKHPLDGVARVTLATAHDKYPRAGLPLPSELPLGAIVAICGMVDCCRVISRERMASATAEYLIDSSQRPWGDFSLGPPYRFGWILINIRRLPVPLPFNGHQGFFDVSDQAIESAMRTKAPRPVPTASTPMRSLETLSDLQPSLFGGYVRE